MTSFNVNVSPSDKSLEMPRKYAVLKQFTQDLNRLLTEGETAFAELCAQDTPGKEAILALFRPIHSLKGICGMVEEAKILVRAFHLFEDSLPPLFSVRPQKKADYCGIGQAAFQMAREVEQILYAKLDLWKKLGAGDNESRGLILVVNETGLPQRFWIPVTELAGLVDHSEVIKMGTPASHCAGESVDAKQQPNEVLLVESGEGTIAVFFAEIETTCTRLDAVQAGVATTFQDWWKLVQRQRLAKAA